MKRYGILIAAVVMQMCLGATYAWATFVQAVREHSGIGQGVAQAPFTVFYTVFPLTAIFGGMLLGRLGPRRCAVAGGIAFGSGWMLASLGAHSFAYTILGIGVLGGVGVGLAYLVPIATCVLWFPQRKGLVTGIAVAGFGGGAALVSCVGESLMSRGLAPFAVFGVLGASFLLLVTGAGSIIQRPLSGSAASARVTIKSRDLWRDRMFQVLYFAMFCGLVAGFMVNANIRELGRIRSGAAAVGWFALANAAGRIVWGASADRFGHKPMIVMNLFAQAIVLGTGMFLVGSASGLSMFAAAAGFNYGGVLVLFAAGVARTWGAERLAPVYGWLFSSNVPAALAPMLAGLAFDYWVSFTVPLAVAMALLMAAATCVSLSQFRPVAEYGSNRSY